MQGRKQTGAKHFTAPPGPELSRLRLETRKVLDFAKRFVDLPK